VLLIKFIISYILHTTRWRLPLASASLFALVLFSLDLAFEYANWTGDPEGCTIASGMITMFFVFLKQSVNFFLYDRAKMVHEALQITDWRLKTFRWIVWLNIAIGVHLFFAWSYFINFFGRVSTDTDCIYLTKYPAVIIAFAASDSLLNCGMLILFVAPLYLEMKKSAFLKTKATEKVEDLMIRNMRISLIVLFTDISALGTMAYFFINTNESDPSQEYLILWGNFAAVVDQVVAVLGTHAMTGGWIPLFVRRLSHKLKLLAHIRTRAAPSSTFSAPAGPGIGL